MADTGCNVSPGLQKRPSAATYQPARLCSLLGPESDCAKSVETTHILDTSFLKLYPLAGASDKRVLKPPDIRCSVRFRHFIAYTTCNMILFIFLLLFFLVLNRLLNILSPLVLVCIKKHAWPIRPESDWFFFQGSAIVKVGFAGDQIPRIVPSI